MRPHVPALKRLLMVAFHFPPLKGSSGLLRTLAFCRDLRAHGWLASVISAHPRAYPSVSDELLGEVPTEVRVRRAQALDVARHLSVSGRYPGWFALPDRWWPWVAGGIVAGIAEVRAMRPCVLWSTYPIASAHLIGFALHRLFGLPWIADFRDPMVERDGRTGDWYPAGRALRSARLWVERLCARHAALLVFCTETARRIFVGRHGGDTQARSVVIANGYDESLLEEARLVSPSAHDGGERPFMLLHSGVLYPTPDRDPTALFDALAALKRTGALDARRLRVVLRASGSEGLYRERIAARAIGDIVELTPPIAHRDALAEMLSADGLLIVQGYTSDPAIPAKLYEYIGVGRPVLALAHPDGETARLVASVGNGMVVDLASPEAIGATLERFIEAVRQGRLEALPVERSAPFRRKERARELAGLLDELSAGCVRRNRNGLAD